MGNLEEVDEDEGENLSFKEEKLVVQSKMNTMVQSLVSTIEQNDSIGQLILKKPKSDLCQQAWQDGIGIKMCLRILEQAFDSCLEQFNARAEVLQTHRREEAKLRAEVRKLQKEKKELDTNPK